MNVDLIFKIAAIGIIVAVLNQVLIRSGREEQAMMTTLAGLIVVLLMIVYEISGLFTTIKPYSDSDMDVFIICVSAVVAAVFAVLLKNTIPK